MMSGLQDTGRRDSIRVKARIKVRFKNSESFVNEYTHNISKGGLFIRTGKPCQLRDKIEVLLVLPESNEEIPAIGEVIHVVTLDQASDTVPAGMGLQILELKPENQNRIEGFIRNRIKNENEPLGRRQHPRIEVRVRVRFESKEALVEEYIHNISHGGIFIQTQKPKSSGERFSVILVHPESGEEMALEGEVVRVINDQEAASLDVKPGMGVKFLDMAPAIQSKIDQFIRSETKKQAGRDLIVEEE